MTEQVKQPEDTEEDDVVTEEDTSVEEEDCEEEDVETDEVSETVEDEGKVSKTPYRY